jgi:hypothetical protein
MYLKREMVENTIINFCNGNTQMEPNHGWKEYIINTCGVTQAQTKIGIGEGS